MNKATSFAMSRKVQGIVRKAGMAAMLLPLSYAVGGCASAQTAPDLAASSASEHGTAEARAIYAVMKRVADWQLSSFNPDTNRFDGYDDRLYFGPGSLDSHSQGWVYAAFHVGFSRWAKLAERNGDPSYFEWQERLARDSRYLFAPRFYDADDYAIGQLYLDLYRRDGDAAKITPLKTLFDMILHNPPTGPMEMEKITMTNEVTGKPFGISRGPYSFGVYSCKERWCWADAMFMGPPVWIELSEVTGDPRYLEFADKEFWATVDLLWDEDDRLFFRDSSYFDAREQNGEKVIWARGVGWVAGLARMLEHLPKDHPRRADYEDIFRKMMTRLAAAQQADGLWRPSVLDPESKPFKETSGTALMGFAFASGINQGVLDRETFEPVADKAWAGLVTAIQPDGKLGWVQQIGEAPASVSKDDTQLYAVGAFLAMGTEMYALADTRR